MAFAGRVERGLSPSSCGLPIQSGPHSIVHRYRATSSPRAITRLSRRYATVTPSAPRWRRHHPASASDDRARAFRIADGRLRLALSSSKLIGNSRVAPVDGSSPRSRGGSAYRAMGPNEAARSSDAISRARLTAVSFCRRSARDRSKPPIKDPPAIPNPRRRSAVSTVPKIRLRQPRPCSPTFVTGLAGI